MKQRLNTEQKINFRWPLILLAANTLFVLTYFLIPMWLGKDIYLAVLIPHFQSLILVFIGGTLLLGARLYCIDFSSRQSRHLHTERPTRNPLESVNKLRIAAISQFLTSPIWSIELIQKLSPAEFIQLSLAYYDIKGIPHRTNTLGLTSGLNILICQNDIVSKVIHCSNDQIVKMNALRHFLGVMVHERAHAGVYIHRGTYSEEVSIFAASHNIQLRNEYALLAKIEKLSDRRKKPLLKRTKL